MEDTPAEDLTADVELLAAAAPDDAVLQAERVRKLERMLRQLTPKARGDFSAAFMGISWVEEILGVG